MKTSANILLAGLLCASGVLAQSPKSSFSITADIPYTSSYVFRGVELARDSLQPSLTFTSGSFSAGVWTNQPVVNNADNEFDFFAGYDFSLNKDWKLNLGGTIYLYPELDASTGLDRTTYEPKVSLAGPLGPVSSTFTVFHDLTLKATTIEGAGSYSVPMQGRDKDTVDFIAAYGHVSPDAGSDYSYWSLGAKATFRPKENLSVYLGAFYSSNDLGGAKRDLVYGIVGISLSL